MDCIYVCLQIWSTICCQIMIVLNAKDTDGWTVFFRFFRSSNHVEKQFANKMRMQKQHEKNVQ